MSDDELVLWKCSMYISPLGGSSMLLSF